MVDDGRAGLDHLGRLALTGVGMGALVGATTAAVALVGDEGAGEYLQGYLIAGAVLGMLVGVVAGAGIAALALAVMGRRPRSGPGLEPVTVIAAVVLTAAVVVAACTCLDATATATVAAAAGGTVEAVLALRLTRRWRWAALRG